MSTSSSSSESGSSSLSSRIRRVGESGRWSDVVIYNGQAQWVEVASDMTVATADQAAQILLQIDETLQHIGSDRGCLLQIVVYLADLADVGVFNERWDAWVPVGAAPVRACVQAGLSGACRVEMIVTAACP